jgi:hypothetical protein
MDTHLQLLFQFLYAKFKLKIALKNQTGIEEWIVKKVCDQNFYFLLKLCFNS